jgi:hypothetical protein
VGTLKVKSWNEFGEFMNLNQIKYLNYKMIKMVDVDKDLGISHKQIDFENSEAGIWSGLESREKFTSSIKSRVSVQAVRDSVR